MSQGQLKAEPYHVQPVECGEKRSPVELVITAVAAFVDAMVRAGAPLQEFEGLMRTTYLKSALKLHGGNKRNTARALGVHRNTLGRMMAECELDKREGRG